MPAKLYTVEEARQVLEELKPKLEDLQKAQQDLQHAVQHGRDLEQMYDEEIHDPDCPEHEAYVRYTEQAHRASVRVRDLLSAFHERDVEVKDIASGLLDFHVERDGGEIAYLCWKKGEETIEEWHPLFGGYRARRPLDEL